MFARLFSESGLSLDRLRSLVEVGAAGSIAQAAGGNPVKQSQYSRQIKELEEFFRTTLLERYGKGVRFTANGRELARISRFLMMGLSNFQRGCLGEQRTYRIGASPSFIQTFLLPLLSAPSTLQSGIRFAVEALPDDLIEQRLHELLLDFGVVTRPTLSRPLQSRKLLSWHLRLFVPAHSQESAKKIMRKLKEKQFGFTLAAETPSPWFALLSEFGPALICHNFLEARSILEQQQIPSFLPDFIACDFPSGHVSCLSFPFDRLENLRTVKNERSGSGRRARQPFQYSLSWNPRLLRLNPQAVRQLEWLQKELSERIGA